MPFLYVTKKLGLCFRIRVTVINVPVASWEPELACLPAWTGAHRSQAGP